MTSPLALKSSIEVPLEKVWEFEASDKIEPWSTPIVAHGMVFFGCKDGSIYALETTAGQEKWMFKMGKRLRVPLLSKNGIIYATSDDKNFYAVSVQTGEKLWQFSTGKDILYWPFVENGNAYLVTKDKNLYALDAKTGVERWRFSTGKDLLPPNVDKNLIFLGSQDRYVYALDANSGSKKWGFKSGHKNHSPPAISKDRILISGDDDLYAIDVNDGTLLWSAKKVNHGWHKPVVAGDYVLCTKELTILNLSDGTVLAKLALGQTVSNIIVQTGTLYASMGGIVFAIDLLTKKLKWYAVVEPQTALHLRFTLGKEFVFVTGDSQNGMLSAISTSRFMRRWEFTGLSQGVFDNVSGPVITEEMVIVSRGKRVSAFKSSKDPASKHLLEIGDDVAPSPKYIGIILLAKEGFLGGKGEISWPNRCCLCGRPAEKKFDLMKKMDGARLSAPGIPYCASCYEKTREKGIFKKTRENLGVEILRTSPPTFAFRNEKYWAMFMEANRTR